jgi:hypothetical protein
LAGKKIMYTESLAELADYYLLASA